jgi:hypothetical protein
MNIEKFCIENDSPLDRQYFKPGIIDEVILYHVMVGCKQINTGMEGDATRHLARQHSQELVLGQTFSTAGVEHGLAG